MQTSLFIDVNTFAIFIFYYGFQNWFRKIIKLDGNIDIESQYLWDDYKWGAINISCLVRTVPSIIYHHWSLDRLAWVRMTKANWALDGCGEVPLQYQPHYRVEKGNPIIGPSDYPRGPELSFVCSAQFYLLDCMAIGFLDKKFD